MEKKRKRYVSRMISLLLILTLFGNDIIGGTGLVWAAQETEEVSREETVEDEEEATVEPSEEETAEEPQGGGEEVEESGQETEITGEEEQVQEAEDGTGSFLLEDAPQEVRIMEEDTARRSSNIKYFLNEDHTCTAAIYPEPVHYEEDGEWKEIDNGFEEVTQDGGTSLVNRQNPFKVMFAASSDAENMVEVGIGAFKVRWGLAGIQDTPVVQGTKQEIPVLTDTGEEEEEMAGQDQEAPATLFTENPEVAAGTLSRTVTQSVEQAYGKQLQDLPENNMAEGIPAEQQEAWEAAWEPEEADKTAEDYQKIQEENQERLAVDTSSVPVRYEEIYPDVDLEYTIQGQKLKENILLKTPQAQSRFAFQIETDGMEVQEEARRLLFVDGEGTTVLEMQKPFLYDASGAVSEEVSVELTRGTGKRSVLTLTADDAWLQAQERVYPVTLDPVIETSQSAKAMQDTSVLSSAPDQNYYTDPLLKTGVTAAGGIYRSFLRFELPKLSSGDMVVDARVNVYCYSTGTSDVTVGVTQAYGDWKSQEITWNTQPAVRGTLDDYAVFTPKNGTPQNFSITRMVKEWYESGENGGLMLKATKESGQYTEYVSSDFPIQNQDARPSVLITYLNNSGLEDCWGVHSQDVGRAGSGAVNDYNGNLVFSRNLWSTSGSRMPVSLGLVYNTNDREENLGYGYGWRLNLLQTIKKETIGSQEYYQYVDEDGTRHYFYYDSTGKTWKDESGIDLTLTISANSQGYQIKDKQDNLLIFDSSGRLTKIQDQNKNTLLVGYDNGKITSVQDGKGKKVYLSYNTGGLLERVEEQPAKTVQLTYENNCLRKVQDKDGKTTSYTYGKGQILTGAENMDGYRIQYRYTGQAPYRVTAIQEFAGNTEGQSLTLERYDNRTLYTDQKGRTETSLFNHMGNTISVKNNKGYGQSARYLTEKSKTNKIAKVSRLQAPGKNLLKNGYLETEQEWKKVQSGASASFELGMGKALEGERAMHLSSSQKTGKAAFVQEVRLEAGKDYTFSAYVKTDQSAMEQGKIRLQLEAELTDGEKIQAPEQDYYETENGWYRMMTTLTVPESVEISTAKVSAEITGAADAYVDCLQLEEGISAGRYNLVEEGDFSEGIDRFQLTGTNVYDRTIDSTQPDTMLEYAFARGVVNGSDVNLRSGPGTGYGAVSSAQKGSSITIIGQGIDASGVTWYLTYLIKNRQVYSGYIISNYVDLSSQNFNQSVVGVVDASSLTVRSGAGTGFGSIDTLPRNANVHIVDYVTSAAGQVWDVVVYEKNGTYQIGGVLGEYLYTTMTEPAIEPMQTEFLDETVFYMTGNPAQAKKLTRVLPVSGKAGDSFMGNVWGCGYPTEQKDGRVFGLEVAFVGQMEAGKLTPVNSRQIRRPGSF